MTIDKLFDLSNPYSLKKFFLDYYPEQKFKKWVQKSHVLDLMKTDSKVILRRSTAKTDVDIDRIVAKFSVKKLRLLLTQESILLVKK